MLLQRRKTRRVVDKRKSIKIEGGEKATGGGAACIWQLGKGPEISAKQERRKK